MARKPKTNRRLTEELLETAQGMRASGLMSKAAHEKITMRHLGEKVAASAAVAPSARRSGRCGKRRV
jgi:putative transcriptional regulator